MSSKSQVWCVFVIALWGCGSQAESQGDLPDGVEFDGEWYWRTENVDLVDSKLVEHRGTPLRDGGCRFEWNFEPSYEPPAGMVSVGRELARSADGCRILVDHGALPMDEAAILTLGRDDQTYVANAALVPDGSDHEPVDSETPPTYLNTNSRWTWTGYKDPVHLRVAAVRAYLKWSYNGSQTWITQAGGELEWASWSGWQLLNGWYGTSGGGGAYSASTRVYGYYKNPDFGLCPGTEATLALFNTTRQYGYGDGDYGWGSTRNVWGGCWDWLWFDYATGSW